MAKKKIDLSDIKEKSLEETQSFQDLMTRSEKKKSRKFDDIEEMVKEKRKRTEDLTEIVKVVKQKEKKVDKKRAKNELKDFFDENNNFESKKKRKKTGKTNKIAKNNNKYTEEKTQELDIKSLKKDNDENDDFLSKTQILELTKKMKFNFDDVAKKNIENKKNGFTLLNTIGIINLVCIGFYTYLLAFSSYQDNQTNYLIAGILIISLVLFFGISVVSNRKIRKIFNILNIIAIILFIIFSIYIYIK